MPPEKKRKNISKTKPRTRSVKTSAGKGGSGGNTPFYVLVIIILITVIVLLLNRFYDQGRLTIPGIIKGTQKVQQAKDKPDIPGVSKTDTTPVEEKKISDNSTEGGGEKKTEMIKEPEDKEVKVYFLKLNEKTEKIYLSPVKRKVPDRQLLTLTLEQLIKGPSKNEEANGFITAVPSHLKIRSIEIRGKTAEIDFNGVIEEGAAGDILLKRLEQIVYTATQFDSVDSIIIRINGQRRNTIGADGYSISGPLRK